MKRILFISSFHPGGQGQIGAGEAISGSSLNGFLTEGAIVDVYVLSPKYQRADENLLKSCNTYVTRKVRYYDIIMALAANIANGSLFAPWFFTRVQIDAVNEIKKLIKSNEYDFVWLDFPSSLGFAASIIHPDIRYCAHDVVAQRIGRSYTKCWLKGLVRTVEASLFKKLHKISVLSEKDRELVRGMGFSGDLSIIKLSEQKVGYVDDAIKIETIVDVFHGRKNLVFFGNMKRAENHWSIIWFILFVFLRVYRKKPALNLWVLGICPRLSLRILSKIISNVHVIGAVDDPSLAFKKADICIAPLLFGAGVKIKVIQMLDAGAKVLATPVGAEGVSSNENLIVVQPRDFYNALLQDSIK